MKTPVDIGTNMNEDDKKNSELVDGIMGEIIPKKSNVKLTKEAKIPLAHTKSPPIKAKQYYDVKVECTLPATITFRVLAEDPREAADLIRGAAPISVVHRLVGRKDHKLSVYDAGSTMLRWMKNLIGR